MSPYRMLMSVSLSLSLIGLVAAQGTAPPKAAPKAPPAVVKPAPKGPSSAVKTAPKASAATVPAAKAETKAAVPEAKPEKPETKAEEPEATAEENPHAADMAAIVKNAETFVAAFNQADAAALAELFTPDAEYIDETGEIFQGRQAIQDNLSGDFAENAGAQLELEIESIRFIGPGVAVEDGYSTLQDAESTVLSYNHYSAILVKVDDRWLTASVRDRAPKDRREHRAQLSQLNWLIGDWVDESPDSMVLFNCGPSDDGNFLVRTFTQHIEGEPQFHGTQWIGWDPLNQQIRSWTFDSDGGFSTGVWYHDEENWLLKSSGVTADGEPVSNTTIFSLEKNHHLKWQMVDQEVGGIAVPDGEIITIVLSPPSPDVTQTEPDQGVEAQTSAEQATDEADTKTK